MNVNGVKSAGYQEKAERSKEKNSQGSGMFRESLANTMSEQEPQEELCFVRTASRAITGTECCQSMMAGVRSLDRMSDGAASECEVRGITYDECSYVKLCPEKGEVYKAQVLAGKHQVYVEQKKENGTVIGYLVDMDQVKEDTASVVERVAAEAMEQGAFGEAETEEAFQAALDKFFVYAEERIENGPPRFAIGASELTIEEWDKLIERVDEEIDSAKEDLRERTEEKEEDAQKKVLEALIDKRKAVQEKGPYSFLAGEDGSLVYNGIAFTYDQSGALCLGNMGNPDDVITVYLTDGVFKLNRDNIGELSQAIGMFSPEDINRILRAISQDAKCKEKLKEIEDEALKAYFAS